MEATNSGTYQFSQWRHSQWKHLSFTLICCACFKWSETEDKEATKLGKCTVHISNLPSGSVVTVVSWWYYWLLAVAWGLWLKKERGERLSCKAQSNFKRVCVSAKLANSTRTEYADSSRSKYRKGKCLFSCCHDTFRQSLATFWLQQWSHTPKPNNLIIGEVL